MSDSEQVMNPEPDQQADMPSPAHMDFVWPMIVVSLIVAILFLFRQGQSLAFMESEFKSGHLRWIVGVVTILASLSRLFKRQGSAPLLLLDAAMSATICASFVLRFGVNPLVETRQYFPAGAVELFAYFYFTFITSLLVPSVFVSILQALALRLFRAGEEGSAPRVARA
jgi:hypothetical protein